MYGCNWPTLGFKGRTFKLCVLARWDFIFCIRSSPLRVGLAPWCGGKNSATLPHAVLLPHSMNGIKHFYVLCSRVLPSPLPSSHRIRTACMDWQLKNTLITERKVSTFPLFDIMGEVTPTVYRLKGKVCRLFTCLFVAQNVQTLTRWYLGSSFTKS